MGVAENFETFCYNLIVSNKTIISDRYKRITKRLNLDYYSSESETSHSLYLGSYGRNTAIKGLSDLDMLFRLPNSAYHRFNNYVGNGQSALLQEVKRSLQKTYSNTDVGGDGQVVIVSFTDGMIFEILPAFLNDNGESYTYPNSKDGGSWKTTNPKPEIDAMRLRDSTYKGNLRRLCRMMRAWKGRNDVSIKGLLIDTLAYQFIGSWENRDKSYLYYDYMARDFLLYLANQDTNKQYWTAPGSGAYVYKIGNFQYKAKQAYNISLEAIDYDSKDMPYTASGKWREIFGTKYPSPS